MQYVTRYYVKPYKANEFQAWLEENEAAYAENAPEGWTYLGTWGTVHWLGKYDAETRWELDDYASLGEGWGDETFQRLSLEWWEFMDLTRDIETNLMKSMSVVSIHPGT
jgi:hypothetical protein